MCCRETVATVKRLCTICARGGSKGVSKKNIRPLLGMPLIAHSIQHATQSGLFSAIAVSSDSEDILDVARDFGIELLIERPADLATDTAAKVPAIRHALLEAERLTGQKYDVLTDLDATSPLRVAKDIRGAIGLLERTGCRSVITGTSSHRSPYFNLVERRADGSVGVSKKLDTPVVRRQDAPACFDMNASVYVWHRDSFVSEPQVFYPDTQLYEMPSQRSVDIDSEEDFVYVEFLMERRQQFIGK